MMHPKPFKSCRRSVPKMTATVIVTLVSLYGWGSYDSIVPTVNALSLPQWRVKFSSSTFPSSSSVSSSKPLASQTLDPLTTPPHVLAQHVSLSSASSHHSNPENQTTIHAAATTTTTASIKRIHITKHQFEEAAEHHRLHKSHHDDQRQQHQDDLSSSSGPKLVVHQKPQKKVKIDPRMTRSKTIPSSLSSTRAASSSKLSSSSSSSSSSLAASQARGQAGAESMFSMSKQMTTTLQPSLARLVEKWQRRWRLRLLRQQRHRRDVMHQQRQQLKDSFPIPLREGAEQHNQHRTHHHHHHHPNPEEQLLLLEEMDIWGIEKARQNLNLPAWARAQIDVTEERHLAAMKIILEPELQALQRQMIQVPMMDPLRHHPSSGGGGGLSKIRMRMQRVVDVFPDVYSDLRLLRFLRKDKIQDPVTAAMRYQAFLAWREDNNVDQQVRAMIHSNQNSGGDTGLYSIPPNLAMVAKHLPCDFQVGQHHMLSSPSSQEQQQQQQHNRVNGKATIPILLQIGSWDAIGLTKLIRSNEIPMDVYIQFWTFMFEALHVELYQESLKRQELVYIDEICDLTDLAMQQFTPAFVSTVLKPCLELTQKNYPETAARIVLRNPPRLFSWIWNLVTPLISPTTLAKVQLQDSSSSSLLLGHKK